MPRANRPEHTRTRATLSRWRGSILAWYLVNEPGEGREILDRLEQEPHAEVRQGAAEEDQRQLPGEEGLPLEGGSDGVQELELLDAVGAL
jgi:hypothetical protein